MIAASAKDVLIGGVPRKIVVFNDARVHPDYRRTVLARHMLGAWLRLERWAKEVGADAICGLVKADNEAMLGFQGKRSEYQFVGRMVVLNRPVFRRARAGPTPEQVPVGDLEIADALWREYGERDFVPVALRERCPTAEMEATGLFSTWRLRRGGSWASIGVYRVSRTMRTRVIAIPWYYRLMGPVFSAVRPVVPLPRIPVPGGTIGYTFVYNHLAAGPQGTAPLARAARPREQLGPGRRGRPADRRVRPLGPVPARLRAGIAQPHRLPVRHVVARRQPSPIRAYFVDPRDMA